MKLFKMWKTVQEFGQLRCPLNFLHLNANHVPWILSGTWEEFHDCRIICHTSKTFVFTIWWDLYNLCWSQDVLDNNGGRFFVIFKIRNFIQKYQKSCHRPAKNFLDNREKKIYSRFVIKTMDPFCCSCYLSFFF